MPKSAPTPSYWKQATKELSRDPVMKGIIDTYKGETLISRGDPFFSLCRSVVGQQISVAAAETIWNRFAAALNALEPKHVAKADEEKLRACGLSRQKIAYLKSLAEHFEQGSINPAIFNKMDDEEVIKSLINVKGIGRWTAEMFLIFCLMRPDVWPVADIGLQKAVAKHYNKGKKLTPQQLIKKGEAFRPWRSVATWYLWRSLDPVPVEY